MKLICTLIWNTSEMLHLPLGRIAPYVFGGMIGRRPVKDTNNDR